jgi:hypothetical protein
MSGTAMLARADQAETPELGGGAEHRWPAAARLAFLLAGIVGAWGLLAWLAFGILRVAGR